jgi:hypothetical protein
VLICIVVLIECSGTTGMPKGVPFNIDRGFQGGAAVKAGTPELQSTYSNFNFRGQLVTARHAKTTVGMIACPTITAQEEFWPSQ